MKKILLIAMAALVSVSVMAAGRPMVAKKPTFTEQFTKEVQSPVKMAMSLPESSVTRKAPMRLTSDGYPETFVLGPSNAWYNSYVIPFGEDGFSYYTAVMMYTSPFVDCNFRNLTPEDDAITGYLWQYFTPEDAYDSPSLSSTERNLTVNYDGGFNYGPLLTASTARMDSTFRIAYVEAGGNLIDIEEGEWISASHTSTAWKDANGAYSMYYNPTQTQANTGSVNTYWLQDEGYAEVGVDTLNIKGFAEFCPKPDLPYMLSSVILFGASESAGTMTLAVVKAVEKTDDDGQPYYVLGDEVLCTAFADVPYDGSSWSIMSFEDLVYTDPEEGLESELIIEDAVFLVFIPDDGMQFAPAWRPHAAQINDTYAYMVADFTMEGDTFEGVIDCNWRYSIGYSNSWMVLVDMSQQYIYCEDDKFEAPVEGGSKNFALQAYYSSPAWEIATVDGDEVPEWLTLDLVDDTYVSQNDGNTYFSGLVTLTATAAALPAGTTYRSCDVQFTYPGGAKYVLHVTQGEESQGIVGDVDGSGVVDIEDVNAVINIILKVTTAADYPGISDVDGNGVVDVADVNAIINIILKV